MKYLIYLALLMPVYSFACSCVDRPSFEDNVKSYDQIFVVELDKYRNIILKEKYSLSVTEILKGIKPNALPPLIQGRTSCDPTLKDKEKWIVFKNFGDNDILLGHCGPHRILEHIEEWKPDWKMQINP